MKKIFGVLAFALFIYFGVSSEIDAQKGNNCWNGCNNGGRYNKNQGRGICVNNINNSYGYDANNQETIKGTMESFEVIKRNRSGGGLHITLKSGDSNVKVHIGPTWYLDDINLDINKGDKLEIFGSKVTIDNDTFFIASKITKDNKEYSLRDKYGFPKWSRNRNRTFNN
ncbi:MAG: hypothetical protein V1773_09385 [bacterium]